MSKALTDPLAKQRAISIWVFCQAATYFEDAGQLDTSKDVRRIALELAEIYSTEIGAIRLQEAMTSFGAGVLPEFGFDDDQPTPTAQTTGSVQ